MPVWLSPVWRFVDGGAFQYSPLQHSSYGSPARPSRNKIFDTEHWSPKLWAPVGPVGFQIHSSGRACCTPPAWNPTGPLGTPKRLMFGSARSQNRKSEKPRRQAVSRYTPAQSGPSLDQLLMPCSGPQRDDPIAKPVQRTEAKARSVSNRLGTGSPCYGPGMQSNSATENVRCRVKVLLRLYRAFLLHVQISVPEQAFMQAELYARALVIVIAIHRVVGCCVTHCVETTSSVAFGAFQSVRCTAKYRPVSRVWCVQCVLCAGCVVGCAECSCVSNTA